MAVRGYVKYRDDASSLYGAMHRLVEAGVGSDMISMEPDVLSVVGSLASGDSLVVCSLYDLANGLPSLMSLLGSVARRGARLSSLDEPCSVCPTRPVIGLHCSRVSQLSVAVPLRSAPGRR